MGTYIFRTEYRPAADHGSAAGDQDLQQGDDE